MLHLLNFYAINIRKPNLLWYPRALANAASEMTKILDSSISILKYFIPVSSVAFSHSIALCILRNSSGVVDSAPRAINWICAQISGRVHTPTYCARARWLLKSAWLLAWINIVILSGCLICIRLSALLKWNPLKCTGFSSIMVRGFDILFSYVSSSSSMKSFCWWIMNHLLLLPPSHAIFLHVYVVRRRDRFLSASWTITRRGALSRLNTNGSHSLVCLTGVSSLLGQCL